MMPPYPFSDGDARAVVRASVLLGAHLPAPVETDDMRVWNLTERAREHSGVPSAVAIGAFDGVHVGHRKLIAATVADARERRVTSSVVTFWPDPDVVLAKGSAAPKLLSMADRIRALGATGVDRIVAFDFTPAFALVGYDRFLTEVLRQAVVPASIHVGSDFRVGSGGLGTVALMRTLGRSHGFDVVGHHLLRSDGTPVSATRIRESLAKGDVEEAAELLGRAHFVRGRVEHGRGEGTGMGFPTANVSCPLRACLPAQGVYAGFVLVGSDAWPAAVNVGAPPTFSDPRPGFLEATLLGFDGDLYGREVCVCFVERLRASHAFSSTAELERVVRGNIDWVGTHLGDHRVEVACDQ